ncbi:MAG TPA: class I SAM-dependent methyltransferase [Gemmatimonadales bacterium]|nr:class I SAM-dependent methyltransferase [Gemmatimonadales bacterium]
MTLPPDTWARGAAYDRFMGRWSRLIADAFLAWLRLPPGGHWLELGCGTGALTGRILELAHPTTLHACEPAAGLLAQARLNCRDPRASFTEAGISQIPPRPGGYDAVVSGLVLNFLPDPGAGVQAMARVATPRGTVAAYVWDYAGGMEFLRHFWDAATQLDPAAQGADEGQRFPLCQPEPLRATWAQAGLQDTQTRPLEVVTTFANFDDYWEPFEAGQGPAPTWLLTLSPDRQAALRALVRDRLPTRADGSIVLQARAWAIAGRAPG